MTEALAAALMEQRDALNTAMAAMHRTHMLLLSTLQRMAEQPVHPLDPNTMGSEQLNTLAERLWESTSLKDTVEATIDTFVESELSSKMESAMSNYVDSLEIEIDCSAHILNRN
jgi:hypothetical protein